MSVALDYIDRMNTQAAADIQKAADNLYDKWDKEQQKQIAQANLEAAKGKK